MWRMSLSITIHEEGGMLKAHTDHSLEVIWMQLQGNIVRNSVGGDERGLNGKNIKTLVCRSHLSMRKYSK